MVTETNESETATPSLAALHPSQMVVFVPREQAERFEALTKEFSGIPGCRVIFDRRVADRRQQQHDARESDERRRGERRSDHLDQSASFVVVVC